MAYASSSCVRSGTGSYLESRESPASAPPQPTIGSELLEVAHRYLEPAAHQLLVLLDQHAGRLLNRVALHEQGLQVGHPLQLDGDLLDLVAVDLDLREASGGR